MKELNNQARIDNEIMKLTKVNEISHVIAFTDKGPLVQKLTKGGTGEDYIVVLDAVPLEKKASDSIIALLS